MRRGQETLFDREEGPLCRGCRWFRSCGAARTEFACQDVWGDVRLGGEEVLAPGFLSTHELLDSIGGPEFDIPMTGAAAPDLPSFLPPIEIRTELRRFLTEKLYIVTTKEVVGTRKKPLSANDIRERIGLGADVELGLLLFGKDKYVERLWNERGDLLPALATGGFNFIGAPSYSTYLPRPRPEFFWATKRSLITAAELQAGGANVIPRVAWVTPFDALRFAHHINQCEGITHVVIDWTGSRDESEWWRQLGNLRHFDQATKGRLGYIINGPSRLERFEDLFRVVAPERICLTGSVLAQPPKPGRRPTGVPIKADIFLREVASRRVLIRRARINLAKPQAEIGLRRAA
jgi:hypothetical protein